MSVLSALTSQATILGTSIDSAPLPVLDLAALATVPAAETTVKSTESRKDASTLAERAVRHGSLTNEEAEEAVLNLPFGSRIRKVSVDANGKQTGRVGKAYFTVESDGTFLYFNSRGEGSPVELAGIVKLYREGTRYAF